MSNENRLSLNPSNVRKRSARTVVCPDEPTISSVTAVRKGHGQHAHVLKAADIERFQSSIEFLPRLMNLPQSQARKPVRSRIGKIDAIYQHLNRVANSAKIHQFSTDPRPCRNGSRSSATR